MNKITPFLWFDNNIEEAINHYMSIFPDAELLNISRRNDATPEKSATVMSATFRLNGQEFMALNGGPMYKFSEAISMFVSCETQAEVDDLWQKLCAGGQASRCGWLKDKFGLSWQVVPTALGRMLGDKDPAKAARVMTAMLRMNKIEIAQLQQAYDES